MTRKMIICLPLVLLLFLALVVTAEAQGQDHAWLLGRWAAEMKVYVSSDNFTYKNMNCDMRNGDHLEFLQSGDVIEAYCGGDRTKAYGLRAIVSGGNLQWQRLGGMTFAPILDRGRWMPVSVNVTGEKRSVSMTFPGYQDNRQDRTVTINLRKE